MLKTFKIILLLLYIPLVSEGQALAKLIDIGGFNEGYFIRSFQDSINQYRIRNDLPKLKFNEVLCHSSNAQVKYISKTGIVTTEQKSKKKKTPFKRVLLNGGVFGEVHELVADVNLTRRVRLKKSRKRIMIDNQNQLIAYLMQKWTDNKEFKHILSNRNMYNFAVGIQIRNGGISIVCDLASLPYVPPSKQLKISLKDYNLKPYNKSKCRKLENEFAYIKELLTDNILLRNDTVYFHFYNEALLKRVFTHSKDGLAVDYVMKNQFPCNNGNRIFPSKMHNGYLFKPVYSKDLFKNNIHKKRNELYTPIATIPPDVKVDSNDEFTLFILQDKHVCQSIYYNNLDFDDYKLNNITPVFDTLSATLSNDTAEKALHFTVHFKKNKYQYSIEDIKPFLDSLRVNNYSIKSIDIKAYSSVEGSSEHNKELQKQRAESIVQAIKKYKSQDFKMSINSQENWKGFFRSIKSTTVEKLFIKKTHEEIKSILASDTLSIDMEPYLAGQRKADITLKIRSILVDTSNIDKLVVQFKNAIENDDIDKAKTIQPYIFHFLAEGKIKSAILKDINIPKEKAFLPLLNNKTSLLLKHDLDSLNKKKLSHYLSIYKYLNHLDKDYAPVKFNKIYVALILWQKDTSFFDSPPLMEKEISSLYNTNISNKKIDQLLLNFYFFAADYYFDRYDLKNRNKYLKNIRTRLVKPNMPYQEANKIAKYFIFQTHIPWAIEVMSPYIKRGSYNEDFLFTFLHIAFYEPQLFSESDYIKLLENASKNYSERFCKLYNKPEMSFQHLKNSEIKQIYCKTCGRKN